MMTPEQSAWEKHLETRIAALTTQHREDLEVIARQSARLEKQARAIQRVRVVLGEQEKYSPWPHLREWDDGWNRCREYVLDALDGGDE